MAASNATKEAIWLRVLLEDMGYTQATATVLRGDNLGCIILSRNPSAGTRVKHIDIRHHFIRERIAASEIDLQYRSTKDMVADIFTSGSDESTGRSVGFIDTARHVRYDLDLVVSHRR